MFTYCLYFTNGFTKRTADNHQSVSSTLLSFPTINVFFIDACSVLCFTKFTSFSVLVSRVHRWMALVRSNILTNFLFAFRIKRWFEGNFFSIFVLLYGFIYISSVYILRVCVNWLIKLLPNVEADQTKWTTSRLSVPGCKQRLQEGMWKRILIRFSQPVIGAIVAWCTPLLYGTVSFHSCNPSLTQHAVCYGGSERSKSAENGQLYACVCEYGIEECAAATQLADSRARYNRRWFGLSGDANETADKQTVHCKEKKPHTAVSVS